MHYHQDAPGDWNSPADAQVLVPTTEYLPMADGVKLFLRGWKTDSPHVLLILHGLGAHSGWFIDMGNALAARGLNIYAVDHRGFGRSEGLRGHSDDYHTYGKDISAVVTEICQRHGGAKVALLGHSMGGIFTAHYATQRGSDLSGALFLNPWIADQSQVPLGTTLGILTGGIFKSKRLWRLAGGTAGITTNVEAAAMLEADPRWVRAETASFFVQILLMRQAMLKMARRITIPALVMQAEDDRSVIPAASRKFYDALASQDKTWKSYPGYDHDSEFQADRSQLDDDIAAWMHRI